MPTFLSSSPKEKGFNLSPTISPHSSQHANKCFSSKTKGPGEQGATGYCPKLLLLKRANMVLRPFHRSHREICTRIGQFLRRNIWMISGGPFLSRPLCFTAERFTWTSHWQRSRDRNAMLNAGNFCAPVPYKVSLQQVTLPCSCRHA